MPDINDFLSNSVTEKPDVDLNAYAQSVGIQTYSDQPKKIDVKPDHVQAVASDPGTKQVGQQDPQPGDLGQDPRLPSAQQSQDQVDAAKGMLQGAGRALQNSWNGVVDVVNYFADFANDGKGKGQGDLIPSSAQLDIPALRPDPSAPAAERFGSFVGQIAAPVAAGLMTGGGTIVQAATAGAVDFMTMDPHQERLTKLIDESYPEFRHTAVFGNMLQWMADNNPGQESAVEGRFKNMIESTVLFGATEAGIKAMSKIFGGTIKASRNAKRYLEEAPKGAQTVEQTVAAQSPSIASEAELAAAEARMGANAGQTPGTYPEFRPATPDEAQQLSLFDTQAQAAPDQVDALKQQAMAVQQGRIVEKPLPREVNPEPIVDGRVNPHSTKFDEAVFDPLENPAAYESRSWDDIDKEAQAIADRPDANNYAEELLKRDAKTQPYSQAEQMFLAKHYYPQFKVEANAAEDAWIAAEKANAPDAAEKLLVYQDAQNRADRLGVLTKQRILEHGSEAGARLNLQKNLGELAVAKAQIQAQARAEAQAASVAHSEATAAHVATTDAARKAEEIAVQAETQVQQLEQAVQTRTEVDATTKTPRQLSDAEIEARRQNLAIARERAAKARQEAAAAGESVVRSKKNVDASSQRAAAAKEGAARAGDSKFQDQYDLLRDTKFRDELASEIRQKYGGEENSKQLAYYMDAIKQLPAGQSEAALSELRRAMQTNKIGKALEIASAYARSAMLSSPRVAIGVYMENISSAIVSVADDFTSNALQGAGALKVPGFKKFAVMDKSAMDAFHSSADYTVALAQEFMGNVKGIAETFKGQARKVEAYKQLRVFQSDLKPQLYFGLNPQSMIGKMLEYGGKTIDNSLLLGAKFVGTADAFFADSIRTAKLKQMAMGEARAAGLEGEEFAKYVQNKIRTPLKDDYELADAFAKEHTMQAHFDPTKPASVSQYASQGVNWMAGGNLEPGGVKAVVQFFNPFVRTAYNVLDFSLQHTLLAPLWDHTVYGRIMKEGGESGAQAAARIMNGTAFLGVGAILASQGLVTGDEPDNPRLARALRESGSGWQPNSIKIGGNYYGLHKLGVLGRVLSLGASTHQIFNHLDENTAGATTMLLASSFAHSMNPADMARGMGEIYTILADKNGGGISDEYEFEKFINGQVGKFVPSVLKDVRNIADPYRRDLAADSVLQGVKNSFRDKVPFWSQEGAVQRNIWGEPMLSQGWERFALPVPISAAEKGSPVKEVLEKMAYYELGKPEPEQRMKLALGMPQRSFDIGGTKIQLNEHEYEKFVLLSAGYLPDKDAVPGKEKPYTVPLKDVIEQQATAIYNQLKGQDVPPALYKAFMKEITKTVTAYRKQAKEFMMADPDFAKRANDVRTRRMEAVNVGF